MILLSLLAQRALTELEAAPSQFEAVVAVIELADRFAQEGRTPMGRAVRYRPGVRRLIAGRYHVFVRHTEADGDLLVLDIRSMRLKKGTD